MKKEDQKSHILIVDDDASMCEMLKKYLTENNFDVSSVGGGQEMDSYLSRNNVDLVVLDLMLPGEDGLSLARRIRKDRGLPFIIVSGRGEDVDRIVGLEIGADDYLPKPFNTRELLARIRAVLRRAQPNEPAHQREVNYFGPFVLEIESRRLLKNGDEISMTSSDFSLLRIFIEHPRRVLSRDQLMDMLKGSDYTPFDRSVDVRITRLRSKIEVDPSNPKYIRTVWGEGYLFTPDSRDDKS